MSRTATFARRLRWRLEALAARGLFGLFRCLGPVRASNLGGALARAIGPLLPVSRVADRNLARAFPDMDAMARRATIRGVWDNLGRVVAEYPHLNDLRPTASGPGWEVAGREVAEALVARGGPALFFSAHIGNWELLTRASAVLGVPLASVYRAVQNPHLDAMIARFRDAGMPLLPKGAEGAKQALRRLAQRGFLGMLLDQKMNDGIEATFFGRPAMTAPAAAQLALRQRCPILPAHVERLGPARFRLVCEPALPLPDTGDRQEDVRALTQAINDRIEAWVRARPAEWLWLHRRWKDN
ncbi:MAG: lauroyl acyltransferase [Alphaproteobacteria bacterium]|nr:lauroyl acyltransferase [Alphaproteobacteria bacterium]